MIFAPLAGWLLVLAPGPRRQTVKGNQKQNLISIWGVHFFESEFQGTHSPLQSTRDAVHLFLCHYLFLHSTSCVAFENNVDICQLNTNS